MPFPSSIKSPNDVANALKTIALMPAGPFFTDDEHPRSRCHPENLEDLMKQLAFENGVQELDRGQYHVVRYLCACILKHRGIDTYFQLSDAPGLEDQYQVFEQTMHHAAKKAMMGKMSALEVTGCIEMELHLTRKVGNLIPLVLEESFDANEAFLKSLLEQYSWTLTMTDPGVAAVAFEECMEELQKSWINLTAFDVKPTSKVMNTALKKYVRNRKLNHIRVEVKEALEHSYEICLEDYKKARRSGEYISEPVNLDTQDSDEATSGSWTPSPKQVPNLRYPEEPKEIIQSVEMDDMHIHTRSGFKYLCRK